MRSIAATLSILSIALAGSLVAPNSAAAAFLEVTTTADIVADDGECSLREAVIAANTNAAVDTCPAGDAGFDNITLPAGHYVLEIAGAGEDAALTGDLDLLEDVGMDGPFGDPFGVVIDAAGLDRVFDIHAPVIRAFFRYMTISGGAVAGEDGGAIRLADAGDVDTEGTCTGGLDIDLHRVTVRDSVADRGGGIFVGECAGLFAEFSSVVDNAADEHGGAAAATGALASVQFNTSTVSGNVAGGMGGGIWGEGPVIGGLFFATVAHNEAGLGGGIALEASEFRSFTISGSILAHNGGGDCWLETGEETNPFSSLDSDGTCGDGPGFLSEMDPLLLPRDTEPVAYRLEAGSPAIDAAGEVSGCGISNFLEDQYGNGRPLDGDGDGVATCDMGSSEAPAVPFVPPPSAQPSGEPLPDTAYRAPNEPSPAAGDVPAVVVIVAFAAALGSLGIVRERGRKSANRF